MTRHSACKLGGRGIAAAALVLAAGAIAAPGASAAPIQWSGNGNYYELIIDPTPYGTGTVNTWSTASAAAAGSTFLGASGHLATITSAAENAFLVSLIPGGALSGFQGAWLGGSNSRWIVGPDAGTFPFSNFGGQEPNNSGTIYMNIGTTFAGIATGKWVDDSFDQGVPDPTFDPVIGYFVEYEAAATVVPEPTSLAVAGLAAGALALRRGRRRTTG